MKKIIYIVIFISLVTLACALFSTTTKVIEVTQVIPVTKIIPVTQDSSTVENNPPPDEETATPAYSPQVAGCPVFPADHIWNVRVDRLPVHPNSEA